MKHLPFWITTTDGRKLRTAHGLTSIRKGSVIDAYDKNGDQIRLTKISIKAHSAGPL